MCMYTCVCTQGPEEGIECPPHHFPPTLESQSLSEPGLTPLSEARNQQVHVAVLSSAPQSWGSMHARDTNLLCGCRDLHSRFS